MPGKYWVIHCDYSLPIRQLPRLWWLFCILPSTRCTPKRQDVSNIDKMPCTEVVSPGQQGSLLQWDVLMPVSQLPALSLAQGHSLGLSTVMNMTGPACRTHQWQGALPYQTVWERWVIEWVCWGSLWPQTAWSCSCFCLGAPWVWVSLHMLCLIANAALALKH